MPNIGPLELGIVVVVALLVFGPKRLPDLGRSTGAGRFRAAIFDCDGLLVDTASCWHAAYRDVAARARRGRLPQSFLSDIPVG